MVRASRDSFPCLREVFSDAVRVSVFIELEDG